LFSNLFQRRPNAAGRTVWPVRSHRLHHVGYGHDPSLRKNLISLKPMGISGTVHPLMVLKDNLGHGPGKLDLLENFIRGFRMDLEQTKIRFP